MIAFSFIIVNNDAHAQLRSKPNVSSKAKKDDKAKKDTKSIFENVGGEILLGNISFFNGLYLSSKLSVGYKLNDRFTLGGGAKLFYLQQSVTGPDPSVFDYGGHLMGKAKLFSDIYFKAEYAFMTYGKDPSGYVYRGIYENTKVNYPLFGLGYMSGTGNWKFGIELLFIANDTARDLQGVFGEYWFGANYNF